MQNNLTKNKKPNRRRNRNYDLILLHYRKNAMKKLLVLVLMVASIKAMAWENPYREGFYNYGVESNNRQEAEQLRQEALNREAIRMYYQQQQVQELRNIANEMQYDNSAVVFPPYSRYGID